MGRFWLYNITGNSITVMVLSIVMSCGNPIKAPTVGLVAASPTNIAITYTANIQPLIASDCLTCHSGTNKPDLTTYDAVVANAATIKSTMAATHQKITWTTSEQTLFSSWITQGETKAAAATTVDPVTTTNKTPTYKTDIAPIMTAKCVSCHGDTGPWSPPLASFAEVSAFALDVVSAMDTDTTHGAVLSTAELATFQQWINTSKPE